MRELSQSARLIGPPKLIMGLATAGLLMSGFLDLSGLSRRDIGLGTIYYWLYAAFEPVQLGMVLGLSLWFGVSAGDGRLRELAVRLGSGIMARLKSSRPLWLISAFLIGIGWLGRKFIFRDFLYSMDEYGLEFQAKILLTGRLFAELPSQWQEFARALCPVFVVYRPDSAGWTPFYEPLYGAILAPFLRAGLEGLLNPLFSVIGVFALARIISRMWPEEPSYEVLGAVLLAISPQFIVTTMSGYTFPAHLALNLVWLSLYLKNERWAAVLVPWVGFVAMGLHQFVPHALFATPFLFRILLNRQWKRCIYTAVVYLCSVAYWMWHMGSIQAVDDIVAGHLNLPTWLSFLDQSMALTLMLTWQSFALGILVILGLRQWKELPTVVQDAAWSVLLTFGFYFFLRANQGHGWGFRYIYPVLGNLVLIAIPGWRYLRNAAGQAWAVAFVTCCAGMVLFVQLPLRAYQVYTAVAPFARVQDYIDSRNESIVVIDTDSVWYGWDLVRNDPFLRNKPKVMYLKGLTDDQAERLRARADVKFVGAEELGALGVPVTQHDAGGE